MKKNRTISKNSENNAQKKHPKKHKFLKIERKTSKQTTPIFEILKKTPVRINTNSRFLLEKYLITKH